MLKSRLTILFRSKKRRLMFVLVVVLVLALTGFAIWWKFIGWYSPTKTQLIAYLRHPNERAPLITDLKTPCANAPFLLPSRGFVGLLYADGSEPYSPFNRHPGIDIFGDGEPGTVPIYAAYDGYLTRLTDWKSSVIIRIPSDPLDPPRQIWTYYTHMASLDGETSYVSGDFPPGTSEKFVKQGTLLGYQGLFAGPGAAPIAMHVHVSVVLSNDDGTFRNETHFWNTLDPSPYFGLTLNATQSPTIPVRCGG